MNISGQEVTYDVLYVSFSPLYCNILIYGFQKFQQFSLIDVLKGMYFECLWKYIEN